MDMTEERVFTAAQGDEDDIGELQVAEYLLLLFAFDTYVGFLEDLGKDFVTDSHGQRGLKILRVIDQRNSDSIQTFLDDAVTRDVSKKQIVRTFRVKVSTTTHASRRALSLRTILNRGGPSTVKAVFKDARARKAARATIASHMLDDPAEALTKYSVVSIQNVRIRAWVRGCLAAMENVAPGEPEVAQMAMAESAPIESAADVAASAARDLKTQQMAEDGAASAEDTQEAQKKQSEVLTRVQEEATEAAREALYASGDADDVPSKAEVVGIATAAAVAASSEVGDQDNIPDPLKTLDPEQRSAALTDGKVLIAAGAGSGKSFTLVQRVKYLVEDRQVPPGKILVSSFNRKAALELKHKIGRAVGSVATAMTVGTLHGTFRKAIIKYGNPDEKAMFEQGFVKSGSTVAAAVNRVWRKCFGKETTRGYEDASPPTTKAMMMAKTKWSGNGISPAQAMAQAATPEEAEAAKWYEMYEGFKGSLGPGWAPPCDNRAEAKREWDRFNDKHRNRMVGGSKVRIRLGDFDDMISVFRDILKRRPDVRGRVHKAFDHVLIDECQDLNEIQHEVLGYMTEHVTDGKDGRSYWMIGDDKQSIYAFRGARPDLFTDLDGKEGWNTRVIRTNYRCPPEVVEMANRLIANNSDQIEMEANPAPGRARGEASIVVHRTADEAEAAMDVARQIKLDIENEEAEVSDNAVLCRTNAELNSYETALLLKGVPYARKGSSSFLGSPETKSFLGYISLATSTDHKKMQESLVDILNKPNRFFVGPDKVERAVDYALSNYARSHDQDKKTVSPRVALRDPRFQEDIIYMLKGVKTGFKAKKAFAQLDNLIDALDELDHIASDEKATTQDLFDAVLEMPGIKFDVDPYTGRIRGEVSVTFRDELTASLRDYGAGDDDVAKDEEDGEGGLGLGNVSFLYELAKPDPEDPGDQALSPETPRGFWAKMERLQSRVGDLRYDINEWEDKQADLPPEDRKPPPGVYLGTAHCSPPDEPVLTTEGWVPMVDLDPTKHRLASYIDSCNQLFWGASGRAFKKGYAFQKESRPFTGSVITLQTERSKTKVTPDHRLRVKLADSFFNKYVVYLMKRGTWWRVGMCKSAQRPYKSGDLSTRLSTEGADAAWILKVFEDRTEALLEEARIQAHWGLTGLTFEPSGTGRVMTAEQLHEFHASLAPDQGPKAVSLLESLGLDAGDPIYYRTSEGRGSGLDKRSSFTIRARNFLSDYMSLPVVKDSFVDLEGPRSEWTKPLWLEAHASVSSYSGPVYSLNVVPHRYYVSGGAVVHNSTKGAQWPNVFVQMPAGRFPMAPRNEDEKSEEELEAELNSERRLAYVALTRPSKNLKVVCPNRYNGKPAGVSDFVHEAGLVLGENVGLPTEEPAPKLASTFVEDRI